MKQNLEWVMGKTEPTETLQNWINGKFASPVFRVSMKWNISVGHYEKIEKWLPFHKYQSYRKSSNYWPPKVWVSIFLTVKGNVVSALAIMKKFENGHHFVNINCMEFFQITDPPKSWVSSFLSVDRNGISTLGVMKKIKNGCNFLVYT